MGTLNPGAGVAGGRPPASVEITYCWASAGPMAAALNSNQPSTVIANVAAFRTMSYLFLSRETSADADRYFVARAAEVHQTNGDSGAWRDAAWHAEIHLVVARIAGSAAEIQDFSKPAAHGNL